MSATLQFTLTALLPILALWAALEDLTSYTIQNWISLSLAGIFLALALVARMSPGEIGLHLGVGFAALVAGMVMFAFGWIGGGDAKLLAACCLWFGWPDSQTFLIYTALAGGAFALLLLLARDDLARAFLPIRDGWVARLATPGEPAPYGVAIAIGALAAFPTSALTRFIH
jgi:prepilin peptidase CpaA